MVAEQQKSYQRALRVIGQFLDREPAYRVSIAEEQTGLVVRSQETPRRADEKVTHFDWERLGDLDVWNTGKRNMNKRPTRHQGLWENFPAGHEVALRKLGAVLDQEGAGGITVSETADGLEVTFTTARGESQRQVYTPTELA